MGGMVGDSLTPDKVGKFKSIYGSKCFFLPLIAGLDNVSF